jgi:hypothetical protein
VASKAGSIGRHALLRTFIATGIAIAAVEIVLIELRNIGLPLDLHLAPIRASGFAANPNAFAFQMALVGCASLVIIRSNRLAAVLLSVSLAAIWLSASRAGLGAMGMALAISAILLPRRRPTIVHSFVLSAVLVALLEFAIAVLNIPVGLHEISSAFTMTTPLTLGLPSVSSDVSNNERWQTILGGFSLFCAHPIFGAGLGAFAESWRQLHGHVQVIHSTPLWLLAEFGLVGAAIIVVPFVCIVLRTFAGAVNGHETAILTLLCCVVLATMALAHELLYQRSFWLLLGAAAALHHGALPWPIGIVKRTGRTSQGSGAHTLPPSNGGARELTKG